MADAANPAATTAPRPRPRPYAYYVLAILFLVSFCSYFDRFVLNALQESMKRDLGLQDWQLGVISGPAFALLYSVSGIPIARLADRLNRASLLAVAVSFWSLMTGFCGFSRSFLQLALCRLGVGMGEGGAMPTSHSLVGDYFPSDRRGAAMSVLTAGGPIAAILSPIVGALVAHAWGWRAAFWVAAVPGVLLVLLIKLTLKEPRAGKTADGPAPPRLGPALAWFWANPTFLLLVASAACSGIATTGIGAFEVSFILRTYGFALPKAGAAVGGLGTFALFGVLLSGVIADRLAGRTGRSYYYVPAMSSAVAGAALLVAFSTRDWALALPALAVAHFCWQMTNGPSTAAVQNLAPPHLRATASALFMFGATAVGTGLGPLLVGVISDRAGAAAYAGPGLFAATCNLGRAGPKTIHAVSAACGAASASGLRTAMLSIACFYFLAMAVSLITARRIGRTGT